MNFYTDYHLYGYPNEVPLITKMEQFEDMFGNIEVDVDIDYDLIEETIKEAVAESCHPCDCDDCNPCPQPCCCELATKEDICRAVCQINHHIDTKFEEIDFPSMFEDLNEQVRQCCCH